MADVCACDVHESGRGLAPCMHHSQRIDEFQTMYKALRSIARAEVPDATGPDDLCVFAEKALLGVRYWHRDHPKPEPAAVGEENER